VSNILCTPSQAQNDLENCLILVFNATDAVSLHTTLTNLPYLPLDLITLRQLLNEYTGLDEAQQ